MDAVVRQVRVTKIYEEFVLTNYTYGQNAAAKLITSSNISRLIILLVVVLKLLLCRILNVWLIPVNFTFTLFMIMKSMRFMNVINMLIFVRQQPNVRRYMIFADFRQNLKEWFILSLL